MSLVNNRTKNGMSHSSNIKYKSSRDLLRKTSGRLDAVLPVCEVFFLCECLLTFHLHTAQCRLQDLLNHVVGMQIGYQDTPGHQGYRWCLQCQGGRWKLVSQRWKVRNMWLFLGWKSCSCSYCGCFCCSPGAYFLVQAMNHICSEQNIAPEFWKYVLHRRYVLVGEPTFWVPTSQQLCWLCKGILPKMILIYVGELLCLQISQRNPCMVYLPTFTIKINQM